MYEINEILQQLKMTIKEFAEHYEIPYVTVRQWAKGLRKPPTYVLKLLNEKIERETKGEQLIIEEWKDLIPKTKEELATEIFEKIFFYVNRRDTINLDKRLLEIAKEYGVEFDF